MVAVYCFISIDKAIRWSLASLMCCRQHDRSTVRRREHCRARLEEPSLPRARICARRSGTPARSTHRRPRETTPQHCFSPSWGPLCHQVPICRVKSSISLSRYRRSTITTSRSDLGTVSFRLILQFLYFCFLFEYKVSIHRKLTVPKSTFLHHP